MPSNDRRSSRPKLFSLLAGVAVSALTLLAWTMDWFVVTISPSELSAESLPVSGGTAAPALAALSLAGLALVAALSIAGPVFRVILSALQIVIGLAVAWSAWGAVAAPIAASAPIISEASGISGAHSIEALVASIEATAWPIATIVFGALTVAIGVFVMVTAKRWPGASRKYQAVRLESVAEVESSPVSDWDSLSDGSDPTSR